MPLPRTIHRPKPAYPIEWTPIAHPGFPPELDGLTVLHLTDLHVRRGRPEVPLLRTLAEALASYPVDLAVFTGDAMNYPGDEGSALRALGGLVGACRARLGVVGVFGNHDSAEFRRRADGIAGIRWLRDEILEIPGLPLRIVGSEDPDDLLGAMLGMGAGEVGRKMAARGEDGIFTIALAHYPTEIYPAAELGLPLVLAGHTHGGQIRLSPDIAPHTSTDLPGRLASGVLRLRNTLCCVPRGLGQAVVELRVNCSPHVPVYEIRRGGLEGGACEELRRVVRW